MSLSDGQVLTMCCAAQALTEKSRNDGSWLSFWAQVMPWLGRQVHDAPRDIRCMVIRQRVRKAAAHQGDSPGGLLWSQFRAVPTYVRIEIGQRALAIMRPDHIPDFWTSTVGQQLAT